MNIGESCDLNILLRFVLGDTEIESGQARNAACVLADQAFRKLQAGYRGDQVAEEWARKGIDCERFGNPEGSPEIPEVDPIDPSHELYRAVRAAFIRRGTTVQNFCIDNDIDPGMARLALIRRRGKKSNALRKKLVRACGFSPGRGW